MKYPNLFSPLKIGGCEIKNRYFMAPMGGIGQAGPQCEFTQEAIDYYVERAKGGIGAIFTGVTFTDVEVDKDFLVPGKNVFPLYNPVKFKETASILTERLHAYDCKIFIQLSMGTGRNGCRRAPSEIPMYWAPNVMCQAYTKEEIKLKIQKTIEAAVLCKQAGFDGVEVHAMHEGYLLDQFAMSFTNHRTDEYGGSLENRLRAAVEICQGIKEKCGDDYPVTMRLGMKTYMKGFNKASLDGEGEVGRTIEEGQEICRILEEVGYDAISVDAGTYDSFYWVHPPMYHPKAVNWNLGKAAKEAVNKIPIILAGRIDEPELGEQTIVDGYADGVVIGRAVLADPDFCNKALNGQEEDIRPCLSCHMGCLNRIFNGKQTGCAVNPLVLRERKMQLLPAVQKKKVMVIGGGVGGMEAARVSRLRGHEVDLYEKSSALGGNLIPGGMPDFKEDDKRLVAWYKRQLEKLGVNIHYSTAVTAEMVNSSDADVVFVCTGSVPIMLKIPGWDKENVADCVSVLTGKVSVGDNVIVVGGGLVGCELALDLSNKGKQVTIVELLPDILSAGVPVPIPNSLMLRDMLARNKVKILTSGEIKEVTDNGAMVAHNGEVSELKADSIVFAVGFRPVKGLYRSVLGKGKDVYEVGDGKKVANIMTAVWDAYEIASKV